MLHRISCLFDDLYTGRTVVDFIGPCFDLLQTKCSFCTAVVVVLVGVEDFLAGP